MLQIQLWQNRRKSPIMFLKERSPGVSNPSGPPIGKSRVWLALYEGSPADFEAEIEFFVFVPRSGRPEAGFSFPNYKSCFFSLYLLV